MRKVNHNDSWTRAWQLRKWVLLAGVSFWGMMSATAYSMDVKITAQKIEISAS